MLACLHLNTCKICFDSKFHIDKAVAVEGESGISSVGKDSLVKVIDYMDYTLTKIIDEKSGFKIKIWWGWVRWVKLAYSKKTRSKDLKSCEKN